MVTTRPPIESKCSSCLPPIRSILLGRSYSDSKQVLDPKLTNGEKQNFKNGIVTLEFWKVFGDGQVQLDLEASKVKLPIQVGTRSLKATGVLGKSASDKIVSTTAEGTGAAKVFYRNKNVIGVTVNQTHYGLFAPTGATWLPASDSVDELSSDLAGKDYFSVTVLPDPAPAISLGSPHWIETFSRFAFAFVTDTNVEYKSHSQGVTTTFSVTVDVKEGRSNFAPMALYRHQHLNRRGNIQFVR